MQITLALKEQELDFKEMYLRCVQMNLKDNNGFA